MQKITDFITTNCTVHTQVNVHYVVQNKKQQQQITLIVHPYCVSLKDTYPDQNLQHEPKPVKNLPPRRLHQRSLVVVSMVTSSEHLLKCFSFYLSFFFSRFDGIVSFNNVQYVFVKPNYFLHITHVVTCFIIMFCLVYLNGRSVYVNGLEQ